MKRTFVQCAEVLLDSGSDSAAPGGAVTVALCGTWDHAGPCRWPHRTSAVWDGRHGQVRVTFVADAREENELRALIERSLAGGACVGPDGKLSRWAATEHGAGLLSEPEQAWGDEISGPRETR